MNYESHTFIRIHPWILNIEHDFYIETWFIVLSIRYTLICWKRWGCCKWDVKLDLCLKYYDVPRVGWTLTLDWTTASFGIEWRIVCVVTESCVESRVFSHSLPPLDRLWSWCGVPGTPHPCSRHFSSRNQFWSRASAIKKRECSALGSWELLLFGSSGLDENQGEVLSSLSTFPLALEFLVNFSVVSEGDLKTPGSLSLSLCLFRR